MATKRPARLGGSHEEEQVQLVVGHGEAAGRGTDEEASGEGMSAVSPSSLAARRTSEREEELFASQPHSHPPGDRRCCRGLAYRVRSLPELFRNEGLAIRNEDSPLQIEMYLVASAMTILLIRAGLYATGYPQLGGNGIHIAHMLWGGLLMFVSQLLTMCFLGRDVHRLAAILGGVGFGAFIDELGKFITSNNDYFFKPTPFLLYSGFCVMFVLLKCVEPCFSPSRFTEQEHLANALNLLSVYSTAGLCKESRLLLLELLEGADPEHPVVAPLKAYAHLPVSASGINTSQEHYYLAFRRKASRAYASFVRNRYAVYFLDTFFVLQVLTQMVDLAYLMLDGSYYTKLKLGPNPAAPLGQDGVIVVAGEALPSGSATAAAADPGIVVPRENFVAHLMASPVMKFLREMVSGNISDDLLVEETDHVTKLHLAQIAAVSISALCVLAGVFFLTFSCQLCSYNALPKLRLSSVDGAPIDVRGLPGDGAQDNFNRRMRAFIWFRRSMLVRLYVTDSLALYHSQFTAFGDVVFTMAIILALSFMITQEESTDRHRRLSVSGSLTEVELGAMPQGAP
jgi:hypothetical protein